MEVWRGKDIGIVAKELTALAEENEMRSEGLIWKDWTSHEEGIKVSIYLHNSSILYVVDVLTVFKGNSELTT